MSYSEEFVRYAVGQMGDEGEVTYRLMFGAYGLYSCGKFIGIVGKGQVYIKPTNAGKRIFPDIKSAPPYEGASDYFVLDELDDREKVTGFIRATVSELPDRIPKKKNIDKSI